MENCNHNYKDGKTCYKCGHVRPGSGKKTPRYEINRMSAELMAKMMNEISIFRALNNAIIRRY